MYNHVHIPRYGFPKVVRTDNFNILKIKNWKRLRNRYRSVYHPHFTWKEQILKKNIGHDLC